MPRSQSYRHSRYHPEYEESRIMDSVDGSIGGSKRVSYIGSRGTARHTGEYINDAFSFLQSEDYNAYKYYEDSWRGNNHADSDRQHHGSYPREYRSHRHHRSGSRHHGSRFGYRNTREWEEMDGDRYRNQLQFIKWAALIVGILLIIVIAIGITIFFVLQKKDTKPTTDTYTYTLQVKFNEPWDESYSESSPRAAAANFVATNRATSQIATAFKNMLINAINIVFANGTYSDIYNSTGEVTLKRSAEGYVVATTHLLFINTDSYKKVTLAEKLEEELSTELEKHVTQSNAVISLTLSADSVFAAPTPAGVSDPPTTVGTGFTTMPPTPFTTAAVSCVPVSEPMCTTYYTNTGSVPVSVGISFQNLIMDTSCYAHSTRFACSAIYPECTDDKLLKPCRMFCEAFKNACNVPIDCDVYTNDDDARVCVIPPGYTASLIGSSPSNQCPGEFQCGTDPPTCVDNSQKCDGTTQCSDGSDETSQRANCTNAVGNSPLKCDFTTESPCQYTQSTHDDFDWTVIEPLSPVYDHTPLATNGRVLWAEASGAQVGAVAKLKSPLVTVSATQCLHFYFHMAGVDVGTLKVYVILATGHENQAFVRSGRQGDTWQKAAITLLSGTTRIVFEAVRGISYLADIAIDDISVTSGACAQTGCDAGDFSCTNGNCQPISAVCNGKTECGDFSDEVNCNCTMAEFRCDTGMCVKDYYRCDGQSQCPDKSDENGCSTVCSHGRHKCTNGECILPEWLCDGTEDCTDATDEANCNQCSNTQFQCMDLSCIENTKMCDGVNDCATGNDEHDCFTQADDNTVIVKKGANTGRLCDDNLPNNVDTNNKICRLIGNGIIIRRNVATLASTMFLKFTSAESSSQRLIQQLETSTTCTGNSVVSIQCRPKVCGQISMASNQIAHGQSVAAGGWPWVAAVFKKNADGIGQFVCGGTIISNQHILTAARCTDGLENSPGRFEVLVGSINKDDLTASAAGAPQVLQVLKVTPAPGYSVNYRGDDLVVLELARKLMYGTYIQPVCLPDSTAAFGPASECYTAGWGATDAAQESSVLQDARQKLWDLAKCGEQYSHTLNDKSLCAGYQSGYIANCQGDTGGPLMCRDPHGRWSLLGTYSYGQVDVGGECGKPRNPSVFTNIQKYLSWIETETQCVFDCTSDGSECLYNLALICDGTADCSNRKDETDNSCPSSSVNCDFSDKFKCGYTTPPGDSMEWIKGMASQTANRGPIADHTQQNSDQDYYMYGQKEMSVIVSPAFSMTTPHCLSFYTQMRGESTARMRVFLKTLPQTTNPWDLDIATLETTDIKFEWSGSRLNGWLRNQIDVPANGNYVFGVVASATGSSGTGIGLDDVLLSQGACSAVGCPANTVVCESSQTDTHNTCIPTTHKCNYIADCVVSGTDEVSCASSDFSTYSCTFDMYGACGLEQHHSATSAASDQHEWRPLSADADQDLANRPPHDATTPSTTAGQFLLMDTRAENAEEMASITLTLGASHTQRGCFGFKYWMHSEGSLLVTLNPNTNNPWRIDGRVSTAWSPIQISIASHVNKITITGIIGTQPALTSFIAIDDLTFSDSFCSAPDCSSSKFTCSDGFCIDGQTFCNGIKNCDNNEDEPSSCMCQPAYFTCKYSRQCINEASMCNGVYDCVDKSDEENCNCTSGMFKCDSGLCIAQAKKCDQRDDCGDNSDEATGCPCSGFMCDNGLCVGTSKKCDGKDDCGDESDEAMAICPSCQTNEMKCSDNTACIPKDWKCDGWKDCRDNSDEDNCMCGVDDDYRCNDANQCVSPLTRCNGVDDCSTMHDEEGCGSNMTECFGQTSNCDCGVVRTGAANQLVGGQVAALGTWPWSCALYNKGSFWCGCVLISDYWVLTAAHCLYDNGTNPSVLKTYNLRIRVGITDHRINAGGVVYSIAKTIHQPDYTYGTLAKNDLALAMLKERVTLSETVKPVCRPAVDQVVTPNSHCFSIGWGRTSAADGVPVDMRESKMKVFSQQDCANSWSTHNLDTAKQICAGYKLALIHTCAGDSGSPLMCRDAFTGHWQLAGLVSGGNADCGRPTQSPSKPSVFTRVPAYTAWIQQTITS